MSTYWSRIKIDELYLPFRRLIEKLHANCIARGAEYYATSGYRSVADQNALYALGRTVKNTNPTAAKPMGDVVTNAKGGQSFHNFQIAIDFCYDKDKTREGLQPDWNAAAYKILAEEAEKLGLEAGANWTSFKDYPHIQLKISKVGLSLKDLQKAHTTGGQAAVVTLLNKHTW